MRNCSMKPKNVFILKLWHVSTIQHLLSDSLRFTKHLQAYIQYSSYQLYFKEYTISTNVTYKSSVTTLQFPGRSNFILVVSTYTPALPVVCSSCCWLHLLTFVSLGRDRVALRRLAETSVSSFRLLAASSLFSKLGCW